MAILKMQGGQMFNFVVSESNDWRSRDEVEVTNTGTEPMLAGTLLSAGATANDPLVARAAGAAVGILGQTVNPGETVKRTAITRDAEVNFHFLQVGEATPEAIATALRPLGIIVRWNVGLRIDPVNQLGGLPDEG